MPEATGSPIAILILGAGYGGLRLVQDLAALRLPNVRLIVVDKHAEHQLTTQFHRVAAGLLSERDATLPFGQVVPNTATLVRATVTRLDPDERRVETSAGPLSYDRLVVALGSVAEPPSIPGLAERVRPLRTWDDALALEQEVAADADPRGYLVIGGGTTGVQVAAALAEKGRARHRRPPIWLVEATGRLLPGLPPLLGSATAWTLRGLGVRVRTGSGLKRVTAAGAELASGELIPFGVGIWAGGLRPLPVLRASGLPLRGAGLAVDRFLRVDGWPAISAIGDAAALTPAVAPSAQLAVREGRYLAERLARELRGRPIRPYDAPGLGQLVPLGSQTGVGLVLGLPVIGPAAQALDRVVLANYLAEISGAVRGGVKYSEVRPSWW